MGEEDSLASVLSDFLDSILTFWLEEFHQHRDSSSKEKEKDLYEVLGLKKNANANEIKKKYFALAKTNHPDKGGDPEKVSI